MTELVSKKVVKLVFIHHSCGSNLLCDTNGGLGIALKGHHYYVSDTYYGWGPDSIGSQTDIGHLWDWFCGPDSNRYLQALYTENHRMAKYSGIAEIPEGENEIILIKSCFPNSELRGEALDRIPPIDENPLKGLDCYSEYHTVANAKGIYIAILDYFKTRQDKLFIIITAPPVTNLRYSANARVFNNWLAQDWLKFYPYNNVGVYNFYNLLTGGCGDVLKYPSAEGDDHPCREGNIKATTEFIPILNAYYDRFKNGKSI